MGGKTHIEQMISEGQKWAFRRVDGRYDNVCDNVYAISYLTFPVIGVTFTGMEIVP